MSDIETPTSVAIVELKVESIYLQLSRETQLEK
jgi:hypothetical protein